MQLSKRQALDLVKALTKVERVEDLLIGDDYFNDFVGKLEDFILNDDVVQEEREVTNGAIIRNLSFDALATLSRVQAVVIGSSAYLLDTDVELTFSNCTRVLKVMHRVAPHSHKNIVPQELWLSGKSLYVRDDCGCHHFILSYVPEDWVCLLSDSVLYKIV